MITNKIHISQSLGNRLDVSFYRDRFDFISKTYPSIDLQKLLYINPPVSYKELSDDDVISFIPMEVIDEKNGVVAEYRTTTVANNKGFTKFEDNDLLWAKITPCMQNGKSAIVRDLENGVGCGSTEFYVLRPKSSDVLIEYIHYILRDPKVLESAKNSFGGSAGQQRVSSSYLKSIKIPLPPIEVQRKIVKLYTKAQTEKQSKEQQAAELLAGIDTYLLDQLGITLPEKQERQLSFKVNISNMIGQRFDVSFYRDRFELNSSKYSNFKLSDVVYINPSVSFKSLNDDDEISFVPMEVVDDVFGEIAEQRNTLVSNTKGFTKFEEGDLLWAKITPCMQNGKSAIAYNLTNGIGCGSTEFYVLRPKDETVSIEYIYCLLRHHKVLEAAKNSFGGSAGQQRVSSGYLKSIIIPRPSKETQMEIATEISKRKSQAKQLQQDGATILAEAKNKIEKIILG